MVDAHDQPALVVDCAFDGPAVRAEGRRARGVEQGHLDGAPVEVNLHGPACIAGAAGDGFVALAGVRHLDDVAVAVANGSLDGVAVQAPRAVAVGVERLGRKPQAAVVDREPLGGQLAAVHDRRARLVEVGHAHEVTTVVVGVADDGDALVVGRRVPVHAVEGALDLVAEPVVPVPGLVNAVQIGDRVVVDVELRDAGPQAALLVGRADDGAALLPGRGLAGLVEVATFDAQAASVVHVPRARRVVLALRERPGRVEVLALDLVVGVVPVDANGGRAASLPASAVAVGVEELHEGRASARVERAAEHRVALAPAGTFVVVLVEVPHLLHPAIPGATPAPTRAIRRRCRPPAPRADRRAAARSSRRRRRTSGAGGRSPRTRRADRSRPAGTPPVPRGCRRRSERRWTRRERRPLARRRPRASGASWPVRSRRARSPARTHPRRSCGACRWVRGRSRARRARAHRSRGAGS